MVEIFYQEYNYSFLPASSWYYGYPHNIAPLSLAYHFDCCFGNCIERCSHRLYSAAY